MSLSHQAHTELHIPLKRRADKVNQSLERLGGGGGNKKKIMKGLEDISCCANLRAKV